MHRNFVLAIALVVWSLNGSAQELSYKADVRGMVCAFCAYSVGKNISALEGVDAESVDVDLKNGHVAFRSTKPVAPDQLKSAITAAGFSLVGLTEVEFTYTNGVPQKSVLAIDMKLDGLAPAQFQSVLEAVGQLAASTQSRMVLRAPEALEGDLLKPVLMGRQQVMKVRFVPSPAKAVHLQLFLASTSDQ